METIQTKATEQELFYQNCIHEFGQFEEAMKDIAQRSEGNTFLCSEYLCGSSVLSCTNVY